MLYYFLIFKVFKKYINKIIIFDNLQFYFYIDFLKIHELSLFLKNSLLFNIQTLIDMSAIDWIWRLDRFSVYYNFYSYVYNYRFMVLLDLPIFLNYIFGLGIESINSIFKAALWLEREIWDLFGIYFYNHFDLRRILTDYGFNGFPLRKDFPLVGFKEIRYDDVNKLIVFDVVKLTQEYRAFTFINPWV